MTQRMEPHSTRTASGIEVPDPDQGTLHVVIHLVVINVFVHVWEPFDDGTEGGHNLFGFVERWDGWTEGNERYLYAREPRFGHVIVIPRSLIPHVAQFALEYRRREDTRAGVRGATLAVPGVSARRRLDGAIEVQIPTR